MGVEADLVLAAFGNDPQTEGELARAHAGAVLLVERLRELTVLRRLLTSHE